MRSPRSYFLLALCVLLPWQIAFVASNPWLMMPPKPIGDGPDYENIAYHLSHGRGWSYDWTDPDWRAEYLKAELRPSIAAEPNSAQQVTKNYALQLSRRDGLAPTTARPPLLPAVVAVVYWILERGPVAFAAVRLLLAGCLAIAGALAVALTARITAALTTAKWPVFLAATATLALACADRTLRSYATDFLTEPIALLFVQLWLWCMCRLLNVFQARGAADSADTSTPRQLRSLTILAGILLSLLVYTRSTFVLWLPGVWLLTVTMWCARLVPATGERFAVFHRERFPQGFAIATRMIAVCVLVCAPWWIRNCVLLQAPMPLGTQGATTLLGGYSDDSLRHRGEWQIEPENRLRERLADELDVTEGASQVSRDVRLARAASQEVQTWIRQHLTDLPRLVWYRLVSEWSPYTGRALIWKVAALLGLGFLALTLPRTAAVLGGVLLINTLMVMALYSVGGRFLVPTYGLLYTLAGLGIASPTIVFCRANASTR